MSLYHGRSGVGAEPDLGGGVAVLLHMYRTEGCPDIDVFVVAVPTGVNAATSREQQQTQSRKQRGVGSGHAKPPKLETAALWANLRTRRLESLSRSIRSERRFGSFKICAVFVVCLPSGACYSRSRVLSLMAALRPFACGRVSVKGVPPGWLAGEPKEV